MEVIGFSELVFLRLFADYSFVCRIRIADSRCLGLASECPRRPIGNRLDWQSARHFCLQSCIRRILGDQSFWNLVLPFADWVSRLSRVWLGLDTVVSAELNVLANNACIFS